MTLFRPIGLRELPSVGFIGAERPIFGALVHGPTREAVSQVNLPPNGHTARQS